MTRYKPIDVNEFQTLANSYLQQQQAAAGATGAATAAGDGNHRRPAGRDLGRRPIRQCRRLERLYGHDDS